MKAAQLAFERERLAKEDEWKRLPNANSTRSIFTEITIALRGPTLRYSCGPLATGMLTEAMSVHRLGANSRDRRDRGGIRAG